MIFSKKGGSLEFSQVFEIGLRGFWQGISLSLLVFASTKKITTKKAKVVEFLGFLKIYFFSNKNINFCLQRKEMFCFDADYLLYYPQMSVFFLLYQFLRNKT